MLVLGLTLSLLGGAPAPPADAAPPDAQAPAPAVMEAQIPAPAAPDPPAQTRKLTRVAVYDLERAGVDERHQRVVQLSLLQELRKLEGLSVIGTDEVRSILALEADKQLLGCGDDSCLGEVADALGVDDLVVGTLARVDGQSTLSLKRIRQREARVTDTFHRRFDAGNGEELLVAIGPAVLALYPEATLRRGATRGVAKEMALRLNPPPLPTWVFATGATASGVLFAGAAVASGFNIAARIAHDESRKPPVDFDRSEAIADEVDRTAYVTWALLGAGAATALSTTVAMFFTDFGGYAELNEAAAR